MRLPKDTFALSPATIAFVYALFGFTWIYASDTAVHHIAQSREGVSTFQTFKGAVFVALSGVLIWGLTSHRERQLRASRDRLESVSQRVRVLQRLFRHNIRNDLNVIQGYVDLVRERADTESSRRQLTIASETADGLVTISEKMAVIDQYKANPDLDGTVDVSRLVADVVRSVEASSPGVTIETTVPDRVEALGDDSIAHVLEELLENAIVHFDGPPADLAIEVVVRETRDSVSICVTDNGPGIPEGEVQALGSGRETSLVHMSSIGLWLVHWLCERLGGTVDIDSAPGEYTSVTVGLRKPVSLPSVPLANGFS